MNQGIWSRSNFRVYSLYFPSKIQSILDRSLISALIEHLLYTSSSLDPGRQGPAVPNADSPLLTLLQNSGHSCESVSKFPQVRVPSLCWEEVGDWMGKPLGSGSQWLHLNSDLDTA